MPIALTDLLDPRQVGLQLNARDQKEALREIIQLLAANGKVSHSEKFLEQLWGREKTRPSVVEHGVVFPHLRTDLVSEIILGCARSKTGILFHGDNASLIFLIGVPQRLADDYLFVVGALARLLHDEDVRGKLMRAKTAAQFIEALTVG